MTQTNTTGTHGQGIGFLGVQPNTQHDEFMKAARAGDLSAPVLAGATGPYLQKQHEAMTLICRLAFTADAQAVLAEDARALLDGMARLQANSYAAAREFHGIRLDLAEKHKDVLPGLSPLPTATKMTEAEAIAADLHNDIDKAGKAHRTQERNAMRLQRRQYSGDFA